ncbi:hypothetical protein COLO4_28250 [Corchorus olitorius]|uniref:Uncharacterized protein n=1 Tax=Corchorus olitorius TaxID=93759 RepID=A0A1R3HMI3_9ROSI|nr:hypothetical protein COLO4_28250 [Corchorus olitorius]
MSDSYKADTDTDIRVIDKNFVSHMTWSKKNKKVSSSDEEEPVGVSTPTMEMIYNLPVCLETDVKEIKLKLGMTAASSGAGEGNGADEEARGWK